MRSQVSPSIFDRGAGMSVPAAVTTASNVPPAPSMTRRVASSASRGRARSTISCGTPSTGTRSSAIGVPPAARTASTTAAPRPEAAPVTSTVPRARSVATAYCLLDQESGGTAGQVGQDDGLPAPALDHRRLGQVADGVVAALGPHVGSDFAQRVDRGVLLEYHHGIDAPQRQQDGRPVRGRHQRALRALQTTDGLVA